MTTMTITDAEWVRENVWVKSMREQFKCYPKTMVDCPCNYGVSGYCSHGSRQHSKCRGATPNTTGGKQRGSASSVLMLNKKRTDGWVVGCVFEVGHPHIWRCSCDCHLRFATVIEYSLFPLDAA